jgi:hypothetical protein
MQTSYEWLLACIASSSNTFQFNCCHTLIELFAARFKHEEVKEAVSKLEDALTQQEIKHSVEV